MTASKTYLGKRREMVDKIVILYLKVPTDIYILTRIEHGFKDTIIRAESEKSA